MSFTGERPRFEAALTEVACELVAETVNGVDTVGVDLIDKSMQVVIAGVIRQGGRLRRIDNDTWPRSPCPNR